MKRQPQLHAWKVTTRKNQSVIMGLRSTPAARTYAIGKITRPAKGCGPLAAFRTKINARAFVSTERLRGRIYRCVYQRTRATKVWYSPSPGYLIEYGIDCLPKGTILCRSIRLLPPRRRTR